VQFEQRLRLNHGHLVGIGAEGMYMQLVFASFKIDIAERLNAADLQIRKIHENPAVLCEAFQVGVALPIKIWAHLFDLEIGHIAHAAAKRTFMRTRSPELEPLDKSPLREHLARSADHFAQANIVGKNANYVRTTGHPNQCLILIRLQLTLGVNLKQFRMQRSLE